MLSQRPLDFERRYVLASAADSVFLAIHEIEPAILVPAQQVAAGVPAVAHQRVGCFRHSPIALRAKIRQPRARHVFTHLTNRDLLVELINQLDLPVRSFTTHSKGIAPPDWDADSLTNVCRTKSAIYSQSVALLEGIEKACRPRRHENCIHLV